MKASFLTFPPKRGNASFLDKEMTTIWSYGEIWICSPRANVNRSVDRFFLQLLQIYPVAWLRCPIIDLHRVDFVSAASRLRYSLFPPVVSFAYVFSANRLRVHPLRLCILLEEFRRVIWDYCWPRKNRLRMISLVLLFAWCGCLDVPLPHRSLLCGGFTAAARRLVTSANVENNTAMMQLIVTVLMEQIHYWLNDWLTQFSS